MGFASMKRRVESSINNTPEHHTGVDETNNDNEFDNDNKESDNTRSRKNKANLRIHLEPRSSEDSSCSCSSSNSNGSNESLNDDEPICSPCTTISSPKHASIKSFKGDLYVSDVIIGRGTNIVKHSSNETQKFAFKSPISPKYNESIINEARILSDIYSEDGSIEGVAKFYGALSDIPGLVLQLYPQTLKNHLNSGFSIFDNIYVGKELWLKWAKQLVKGLQVIQQKNIIHCDIKSDNIFLDKDLNAHIGDFSSAKFGPIGDDDDYYYYSHTKGDDSGDEKSFSVQFSAPELLSNDKSAKPSFSSDIYSLGLVLLHVATGNEPYQLASKSIAQKLIWAKRGTPLLYGSDEDIMRQQPVQHILELFIKDRADLSVILEALEKC